jgi:hypothetical protein
MKDAREVLRRIKELEATQQGQTHETLRTRAILSLLSDLAEAVVGLQNRSEGRDVSHELE